MEETIVSIKDGYLEIRLDSSIQFFQNQKNNIENISIFFYGFSKFKIIVSKRTELLLFNRKLKI